MGLNHRRGRNPSRTGSAHAPRRRMRSVRLQLCKLLAAATLFILFGSLLRDSLLWGGRAALNGVGLAALQQCDNALALKNGTGFSPATLDTVGKSVILMLFSEAAQPGAPGALNSSSPLECRGGCDMVEMCERRFNYVAEAFLSSRYPHGTTPYYKFFTTHRVSLWTVDKPTSTRGAATVKPLVMDVVYTYVNSNSPSHAAAVRARRGPEAGAVGSTLHRFRDWEELRYSLRSLYWYALRGTSHRYESGGATEENRDVEFLEGAGFSVGLSGVRGNRALFRHVYVVVADRDQLPAWLNESALPPLRVITHAELMTADEASVVLPTLNSLPLESFLHRIPGISRYFWYFNNDMVLGRTLSPFDLFRPLAPPRQALYFRELTTLGQVTSTAHKRHALFMEPILHVDGWLRQDDILDMRASSIAAVADAEPPAATCSSVEQDRCTQLRKVRHLASRCTVAGYTPYSTDEKGIRRPVARRTTPFMSAPYPPSDPKDRLNNHARLFVMERVEGVLPAFSYAHVPLLLDTSIFRFAMDDPSPESFAADTAAVRRAYLREQNSFSPVHVYTPLALALRRDWDRRLWLRHQSTVYPEHVGVIVQRDPRAWRGAGRVGPGAAIPIGALCPLCADSFSIQQQHPHLFQHLVAWPDGVDYERPRRGSPVENAAHGQFPAPFSTDPGDGSGAEDAAIALYADVFHHTVDKTMRFIMAQDELRMGVSLALVKRSYLAGTPTLFSTVNDDIQEEPGHANLQQHQFLMRSLLSAATSYAPRSPWEREVGDARQ